MTHIADESRICVLIWLETCPGSHEMFMLGGSQLKFMSGLKFWGQEHDTVLRWLESALTEDTGSRNSPRLLLFKICQTLGLSVLCFGVQCIDF